MPQLNFFSLWINHPAVRAPTGDAALRKRYTQPCRDDAGESMYDNQCAVRLGITLKRCGINIDTYPGARCGPHGHLLRVEECIEWLASSAMRQYLPPYETHRGVDHRRFMGRKGIVAWLDFWHRTPNPRPGAQPTGDHIDLWNGSRIAEGDINYFQRSREIWFWELNAPAAPRLRGLPRIVR